MCFLPQGIFSSDWDKTADQYDVLTENYCYGFPCPLLLRIYSPDLKNQDFNGYYISNFVAGEREREQFHSKRVFTPK